ncbi:hypothetical protein L596_005651 [Steinernema carpocapsae]|uniref:Uncharacterized protein n=1 Tax=Steinernema carpocapsae TaxID=34508 RepID=A0A4U8V0X8_STECR|nr:hypothetical protein L596_005651 [Steinernema carpocapsae]
MYVLAPHSKTDTVVAAHDIMYRLPSYHKESDFCTQTSLAPISNGPAAADTLEELTSDQWIEKQVALIKRLTAITKNFQQATEVATKKAETTAPKADSQDGSKGKKGKAAEKAAKKADKAAKKENHKAAGTSSEKTAVPTKTDLPAFAVTKRMPTHFDVGDSIPACTKPRFLTLPKAKVSGPVKIEYTDADNGWICYLQRVVQAVNDVKIEFTPRKAFKATVGNSVFHSRTGVWKMIGEMLGLYSNEYAVLCVNSDQWLEKAESVVLGLKSKDSLMRDASVHLSRRDTVCTADSFGIADFIVAGMLSQSMKYQCNNVELYVDRVSESF